MEKLFKLNALFKESLKYRFHTFETFHPLFFKLEELDVDEFEDFALLVRNKGGKRVLLDVYLKRALDELLTEEVIRAVIAESFDFVELNGAPEFCEVFTNLLTLAGYRVSRDTEVFRRFVTVEGFQPSTGQKRRLNHTEKRLVSSSFKPLLVGDLQAFISKYQKFQVLKGFKLKRGHEALFALEKLLDEKIGQAYLHEAVFEYEGEQVKNTSVVICFDESAYFMYGMAEPFNFKASTFSPGLWSQVDIIKRLSGLGVKEYGLGSFNDKVNPGLAKFKSGFMGRTLELRQILLSKN